MPIDLVIDEREGGSTTSKSSSENPPDPTDGLDQVRKKYVQQYNILNYIYWVCLSVVCWIVCRLQ